MTSTCVYVECEYNNTYLRAQQMTASCEIDIKVFFPHYFTYVGKDYMWDVYKKTKLPK